MPCGGLLKQRMADWMQKDSSISGTEAATVSYNLNAADKALIQMVDVFKFENGIVRTILSYFQRCNADGTDSDYTPRSGVGLDLKFWDLAWLDKPAGYLMPRQSGGPRGYHDCVYILRCKMPAGQILTEISLDT